MNKINQYKLLAVLPLLVLMLFVGVLSFRWMLADVYYQQAKRYITRWEKTGSVESIERWQRARQLGDTAASLHGANPIIQQNLGRVYEWYSFIPNKDRAMVKQYLTESERHYKLATQLRPNYPYVWAALAMVKVRRWEIDDEFAHAILNVRQLGPYEKIARRQAVIAGLIAWHRLDQNTKAVLMELVVLGLDNQASAFFKSAERYRRTEVLCQQLISMSAGASAPFTHIFAPHAQSRASMQPHSIELLTNPTVASKCQPYLPVADLSGITEGSEGANK
jgi:hypothetical protein